MRKAGLLVCLLALLTAAAQADFTFVQVSDTHVGTNQAAYNARYAEVIRQINELKPAFVIHTGDALQTWSPENAKLFREISRNLTPPLYLIPGNHDIDIKEDGAIGRWTLAFGPDRISFECTGCLFIGLDSNLWNCGFPVEKQQRDWLKSELAKAKGRRVFVFEHHLLFTKTPNDPNGDYYAVDEPARGEVLKLLKKYKVEAVLTGHYHRLNDSAFDGIRFITTPATSFSTGPDKGLTGYSVFYVYDGGFTHRFVDLRTAGTPPEFQAH